nr:DUF2141 domain-containing protein [Allomuricauda sp.]
MKPKNSLLVALFPLLTGCLFHLNAQNTKIHVQGLSSPKGQIILKIFQNQEDYLKEKPFKTLKFPKAQVLNGSLSLECTLPKGKLFGIVMFDDANANDKLDRNLIGIPKEGIGFSNHKMSKMKKPEFDDFKFETVGEVQSISIKVQYM